MRVGTTLLVAAIICSASSSPAQQADIKGSRDHPLVPRYAGASIIGYDTRDFDELSLALGKAVADESAPGFAYKLAKSQRVEGKVTRLVYVIPAGRSALEVFRNYEMALKTAGFSALFSCSAGDCSFDGNAERLSGQIYSTDRHLENGTQSSAMAFRRPRDVRYLAARLSAPGKDVYASLMVALETFDYFEDTFNHPLALLEIVETTPMATNMVKVDAAAMAKDIAATDHAVLYGIYFDTGKDVIKPESEPALAEVGKLLAQQRTLKLYVVGHTDNVGEFDANMDLSHRRATAVVAHLRAHFGVEAARLRSVGVGFVAPVASNDLDEGRAKNRRVELVKQ